MPEAARKAKRKAKLKSRSEEMHFLRQRFCHAMRVAAAREDGCMGHAILKAWQNCIQTEAGARRSRAPSTKWYLPQLQTCWSAEHGCVVHLAQRAEGYSLPEVSRDP
eukprot:g32857.t1